MGGFPPFLDASAILYEDEDLVAVGKPPGMPSQAADPAFPDDLPTRLSRLLAERDGRAPALGTHQRLDRETSGVIVFAKSERGNRSLARQLESRSVRKEYVACVRGFRGEARRLEHRLGELDHGRVRIDPRGKVALADVTPLERRGDRALVGVTLLTGRTHQIRVQLAAIDAPIAGDVLYGRDPAPRMMLHASAIHLERPSDGAPLVVRAKVPAPFRRWLEGEDAVPLADAAGVASALRRAFVARASLFEARDDARAIDAFRLLHAEADGVRGLVVDVYGEHAVAQLYEDVDASTEDGILDAVASLGFAGTYLKRRPTNASTVVDTRRAEVAPALALRGRDAASLVIREHGVPYEVRLGDGLSTGIFLDQRDNRRRVRALAAGARVLNLFAYTGAFSCAAASGGAREVVTVDAAAPALEWAERNFALGGYPAAHRVLRDDAFVALDAMARAGERFELVICDPPTYSTTRHGRWTSGADWTRLAGAVLAVLAPGGTAFLCSNDRRMTEGSFRKRVHDAGRAVGAELELRSFDPPSDHPRLAGSDATMKTLRVRRRS